MLIDTLGTSEMNKLQTSVFYLDSRKAYYIACYPAKVDGNIVITGVTQGHSMPYGEPVKRRNAKHESSLRELMKKEITAKSGPAWDLVVRVAKEQNLPL